MRLAAPCSARALWEAGAWLQHCTQATLSTLRLGVTLTMSGDPRACAQAPQAQAPRAQDLRLAPMLDTLRASGRQVFLATNSLWDYTHIVMNFLLHGRTGAARNHDWLEYFDVVITGAPAPPGRRRTARSPRPVLRCAASQAAHMPMSAAAH